MAFSTFKLFRQARVYSIYILLVLLLVYLLNQLDRYTLPIVAKPVAQDLKYGDRSCMANSSEPYYNKNTSSEISDNCTNLDYAHNATEDEKEMICSKNLVQLNYTTNGTHYLFDATACEYNYDGSGVLYQVIAGPIFTVVYTIAGIPLGLAADRYNRVRILTACLILWSLSTLAAGFADAYWNLALARMGLGIGEAGCNPMATSIISDYFPEHLRGSALGIYNFGIYTGYSLAFAIGNDVYTLLSWRWVFFICAIPGIVASVILLFTVKEPQRGQSNADNNKTVPGLKKKFRLPLKERVVELVKTFFLTPSILLLCIAGGVRNGGGYVWAYNTQLFFEQVKDQSKGEIARYMSWIPLVGGSLGAFVGGLISDVFVKKRGPHTRIWVLVISQLLAAPFAAGALYFAAPYCYLCLIPSNVIGEMWVGVTLAVLIDVVPVYLRTSAIAVYFFIITNIGGNVNPLVSVLKSRFGGGDAAYKLALLIMYPGLYALGALLFLFTLFVLRIDIRRKKRRDEEREALFGYNNSSEEEEDERSSSSKKSSDDERIQRDL